MKHVAIGGLLAVLALCACGSDDSNPVNIQQTGTVLAVAPSPMALRAGETKKLNAEVRAADGSKTDVSSNPSTVWTSDDSTIATVDASGNVLGVKGGQTHIKTSYAGGTTSVLVTVVP